MLENFFKLNKDPKDHKTQKVMNANND